MRRFRTLAIPQHVHPLVRLLYTEMNRQRIGETDVAERAGLSRHTLNGWRNRRAPTLPGIAAALQTLGLELVARPAREEEA